MMLATATADDVCSREKSAGETGKSFIYTDDLLHDLKKRRMRPQYMCCCSCGVSHVNTDSPK